MASWANQRIVHDIEGNPIDATGITTKTKWNKNETPKLGPVCQKLGLKVPTPTKFVESRIESPEIQKPKKKNVTVHEYDSVDEESLTGCDDFLTPIIPRKKESKRPRNVLESGSESEEEEEVTVVERKSRKRKIDGDKRRKPPCKLHNMFPNLIIPELICRHFSTSKEPQEDAKIIRGEQNTRRSPRSCLHCGVSRIR